VVAGHSKGAELGLLAASLLDVPFRALIGWAPSSVAWCGLDPQDPTSMLRSSWSHLGSPVPFVRFPDGAVPVLTERGLAVRMCYESALDEDADGVAVAAIPIEHACPTFLVSGGDDQMWPSKRMGEMLVERSRARKGPPVRHLVYESAGHRVAPDQGRRPVSQFFDLGGSPDSDTRAADEAFNECIEFLRSL
jgi:alpha-beta hydrolase superfamily lysophospholipase